MDLVLLRDCPKEVSGNTSVANLSGRHSQECEWSLVPLAGIHEVARNPGHKQDSEPRQHTTHEQTRPRLCRNKKGRHPHGEVVCPHPYQLGTAGLGLREQIPETLLTSARVTDTYSFW